MLMSESMSDPVQGQYYFSGAHLASLKVFTFTDAIVEQIKQAESEDPNWKATLEAFRDKSENVAHDISIDASGMLLFDNRYVLPDNQALKLRVLMANHVSQRRSWAGRATLCWGAPVIPDHPQAHL